MSRPRRLKKSKKTIITIEEADYYYARLLGVDNFSELARNLIKGFLYNRICPTCGSQLKSGLEASRLTDKILQDSRHEQSPSPATQKA